jgi:hypothetical protein
MSNIHCYSIGNQKISCLPNVVPSFISRQTSMPLSSNDRKPVSSPQLQTYFNSQQQQQPQSSSSLFSSNPVNDPAIIYQQQLQRSMSSTNQQQSNPGLYDGSFRHLSSQPTSTNNSSYFSQQSNDIMTRLNQALQTHGKQQQEKVDDQRRRELEFERLKLCQQAQREDEERRKFEQQQRELRKKQELANNRQINFEQLTKSMENKNQSTMDIDPFLTFQQSFQQQASIEAQQ